MNNNYPFAVMSEPLTFNFEKRYAVYEHIYDDEALDYLNSFELDDYLIDWKKQGGRIVKNEDGSIDLTKCGEIYYRIEKI